MSHLCPCHSKKSYSKCCKSFHDGSNPSNALLLMRSRYSGYALQLADYIIKTTHPSNLYRKEDVSEWTKSILLFCQKTAFLGLEILDFTDGEQEAYVTFLAKLQQGSADTSFIERSHFQKLENRWLYLEGVLDFPHSPK